MKVLLPLAIALPLFAGDFEDFTGSSRNYTQRNAACLALRGNRAPEVIGALRLALDNPNLQSCAGADLRVAGAVSELLDALEHDADPTARAVAARELGVLHEPSALQPLRRAAEDRDILVASNAIEGLMRYADRSSAPQLREIALLGGVTTALSLDILVDWGDPQAPFIARKLVAHKDPGDQLVGIRALGLTGDASDVPKLRDLETNDTMLGSGSRGFGLMPAISIARAARTAIDNIEKRAAR